MRTRRLVLPLAALSLAAAALPSSAGDYPPQVARGLTVPVGFAATVFAQLPPGLLPTSLAWGATVPAAAGEALDHGTALYVTTISGVSLPSGDVTMVEGNGNVIAYSDEGVPTVAASGLDQPLGVVAAGPGLLYVSENADNRGRVTELRDVDGNGVFEARRTIIKNLPNGRHQTNGLTIGPDGALYVANGNATDDGVECGPSLVPGGSEDDCPAPEVVPWSGSVLRVPPAWTDVDLLKDIRVDSDLVAAPDGRDDESVLVARGFRNIYDVDFDPLRPNEVWTPMNGPDNPSGSEAVYGFPVDDTTVVGSDASGAPVRGPVVEDAGFPSCLYDPHTNRFPVPQVDSHEHPGEPEPQENTNPRVQEEFGPCSARAVLRPRAVLDEGHEGTAGFAFTRGSQFPARYRGDAFVAEWGSIWNLNGGEVNGHKLLHLELDAERRVVDQREFLTGALPIDVTFGPNGHMYVADMAGQVIQVRHVSDAATPDVVAVDITETGGAPQFFPAVTTVVRGQTVRWTNRTQTPHTVTAALQAAVVDPAGAGSPVQPGSEMDSPGALPPGGSHAYRFTEPGVYHYTSTATATSAQVTRGTVVVLPVER